jgi:hypothetical protein
MPVWNPTGEYYELHGTEGLEDFATVSGNPVRGLYVMSKDETRLYVVAGGKFYRIATDGTVTEKGSLLTSQGIVGMADNGLQIIIVDGPYGYIYTKATDTFAQITDVDFPGGSAVAFKDGYFITVDPDTQIGRTCGLYDGTAWDALDFASAEGDPDPLVSVDASDENVWFYGKVTTEIFYNAALEGFPFQRRGGGVLNFGLAAKNSLAQNDQARFFLARTTAPQGERVVVMVRDFTPTIISPRGLNEEIAKFANTLDAEGFAYMREGHSFYCITFPSANRSFVYDASEQKWHERSSTVSEAEVRWRARCYAYFNGFHMVGDYSTGKIYKLNTGAYSEAGASHKRRFITPKAEDRDNGKRIGVSSVQVPMAVGVGQAVVGSYETFPADGSYSADGSISAGGDPVMLSTAENPMVSLRISHDECKTWVKDRMAAIGKIGEYKKRVRFLALGSDYKWNVELSVSDPVEVKFKGPLIVGG